ncbi:MAG: hypothetical protein GY861_19740 [bacterium]|nr:hypothetical protein [bacterium]
MAIISVAEIIDLVIMVVALGYIFSGIFRVPQTGDPLEHFRRSKFSDIKLAILATAPAIVLHEAGHKIVAMSLGLDAVFHAHYLGLGIGIVLRLIASPFLIFVPGFVTIYDATAPQHVLTAAAGPLMNLILWLGAMYLLKRTTNPKHQQILYLTKKINKFLFIFNMIPIPFLDGGQVLFGLIEIFFGGA